MFGVLFVAVVIYAVVHPKPKTAPGGPGGQAAAGRGGAGGGRGGARAGGPPASVSVAQVQLANVPVLLDALGTVQPIATVTVRPQVSGQLTQIRFTEGQMVRKGQLLVQIDPRPYQNAVNQAAAALARDEATLANAKVTAARYQTLLAQDSIARQSVDDQNALVRSTEALVKSDQAALGTARLSLEYARVTAPISGRVGLRQVDVGNYVGAGQANGLVVITQVAPIDVSFSLPEDNVRQVNARSRGGASLPVFIYDRASSTQLAAGRLLTLDNQIDTGTGTVKAKARFDNGDGALFPNQFVNVKLQIDTLANAIAVPSSAVLRGPNGLYVYLVQPDHTVKIQPVEIGPVSGTLTVIKSGLSTGQSVVIDGTDRLRDGAKIMIPSGCPPGQFGAGGRRTGQGRPAGAGRPPGQGGGFAGRQGGARDCPPAGQAGASGAPRSGGFTGPALPGGAPVASDTSAPATARAGPRGPVVASPGAGATPGVQVPQGAPAEGQGRPFGGGGGMLGQLDLTPAQMQKAQALLAAARQSAGDDPAARGAAMRGAMEEVQKLLTPAQKAKFAALRAQRGAGGQGGGFGGGGGPPGQN